MIRRGSLADKLQYNFSATFMPDHVAAFTVTGRGIAQRNATVVALAAERFRKRNGVIAEVLSQLVPDFLDRIPIDPFDGQPLRYVKLDEKYLIYSIGRNRQDDQGSDQRIANWPADFVLSIPRPSKPSK